MRKYHLAFTFVWTRWTKIYLIS